MASEEALPIAQFEAFWTVVGGWRGPDEWRRPYGWRHVDAAAAAESIMHALGHRTIFAGPPERSALAWWVSRFGSTAWQADSEALTRSMPPENAETFALDVVDRGFDEVAWQPDRHLVGRLNAWCRAALIAYRVEEAALTADRAAAAKRRGPDPRITFLRAAIERGAAPPAVPWGVFVRELAVACGVTPETRGYGVKQLGRLLQRERERRSL